MDELMDMVLKRFEDIVMRLSGEMIDMAYRYVTTAKQNVR